MVIHLQHQEKPPMIFDQFFHEVYMQTSKPQRRNRPERMDEYEAKCMQAEYSREENGKGARRPLKF
jgi:hypothetical protein